MALPSPGRLVRLFAPWSRADDVPVRVWGVDATSASSAAAGGRDVVDAGPPRLLCLAGGDEALVIVRQEPGHRGGLDGFAVPWTLVASLAREPGFRHDVLRVDVRGHAPMRAQVGTHLLLRHNRAAARDLCALAARRAEAPPRERAAAAHAPAAPLPESDTRPIPT